MLCQTNTHTHTRAFRRQTQAMLYEQGLFLSITLLLLQTSGCVEQRASFTLATIHSAVSNYDELLFMTIGRVAMSVTFRWVNRAGSGVLELVFGSIWHQNARNCLRAISRFAKQRGLASVSVWCVRLARNLIIQCMQRETLQLKRWLLNVCILFIRWFQLSAVIIICTHEILFSSFSSTF